MSVVFDSPRLFLFNSLVCLRLYLVDRQTN